MKDGIGNEIREGSLVYWVGRNLPPLTVVKIEDGGLQLGNSGQSTTPKLVLQFALNINVERGQKVVNLPEFLAVVNPNDQKLIEGMMKQ